MSFSIDLSIRRTTDVVFAFLADSRNTPRWYEAVREAEPVTPGPVAVGTRYRFVRNLPGGRADNLVEVVELEPDAVVTLASVDGPTPFRYRYTLSPTPGGTHLRLEGDVTGEGVEGPAALWAPFASRLFARGMRSNLDELKRILEAG